MTGGQAQSGFASSMIHGQNSVAGRYAGTRVPWPTARSTESAQNKGHKESGKFRAFLTRLFGRHQDS